MSEWCCSERNTHRLRREQALRLLNAVLGGGLRLVLPEVALSVSRERETGTGGAQRPECMDEPDRLGEKSRDRCNEKHHPAQPETERRKKPSIGTTCPIQHETPREHQKQRGERTDDNCKELDRRRWQLTATCDD